MNWKRVYKVMDAEQKSGFRIWKVDIINNFKMKGGVMLLWFVGKDFDEHVRLMK